MPKLKALRQIVGDYGNIAAGQEFEVSEEIAAHLETLGVVEPRIVYASGPLLYSTKVITPEAPEVGPRPAFRDVPVRNAKPPAVAAESNPVLPEPDVPAQGTTDSGRWAGRKNLVPENEPIRCIHYAGRLSIGTKRNLGCEMAAGSVIAHWDDDDFSDPDRIADQIAGMRETGASVVAYHAMRFTDGSGWWQYHGNPLGTSLMYRKDFWQAHPFQSVQVNEDGKFCDAARGADVLATEDAGNLMWATIHPSNTSPRQLEGSAWSRL